jgi:hypothetical protein
MLSSSTDQKNAQEKVVSTSNEPGRVPTQVPSADLEKQFYEHHKLWSRRAA